MNILILLVSREMAKFLDPSKKQSRDMFIGQLNCLLKTISEEKSPEIQSQMYKYYSQLINDMIYEISDINYENIRDRNH